jgi:hypothetical protein
LHQAHAHQPEAKLRQNGFGQMRNTRRDAVIGDKTRFIERRFVERRINGGKRRVLIRSILHSPNKKERVPAGPHSQHSIIDSDGRYEKEVDALYTGPAARRKE